MAATRPLFIDDRPCRTAVECWRAFGAEPPPQGFVGLRDGKWCRVELIRHRDRWVWAVFAAEQLGAAS